jgi:polyisoprenoid-binding protein YceI
MSRAMLCSLIAIAMAAPAAAQAAVYAVDPASSRLSFTGSFDGRPFTGVFRNWTAQIQFDPAHLEASSVKVVVQTGSVSAGTPEYDKTLVEPAWFNVRQFPTAMFVAKAFSKAGPNRYVARGDLTIRNVTRPISLPFTLQPAGPRTRMRGELTLDRTQFGLGAGDFSGDRPLAKAVRVNVDLVATAR